MESGAATMAEYPLRRHNDARLELLRSASLPAAASVSTDREIMVCPVPGPGAEYAPVVRISTSITPVI